MHENGEQDCIYCYLFEVELPDVKASFCHLNLMDILTLFRPLPSQSALLLKNALLAQPWFPI